MPRTLLLLRHAKSDWDDASLADFERPLNRRGKRDAPRMGRLLREKELVPDLIVSSPAVRARKTALKVAEACGYERGIELRDELYEAGPADCIRVLQSLSNKDRRVLLVGHNPGLEELVSQLTAEFHRLKTATLVRLTLPIDAWRDLNLRTRATLGNLWRAREVQ